MNRTTKAQAWTAFCMLANRMGKTVYISESDLAKLKKNNKYFSGPNKFTHTYLTKGVWVLDFYNGVIIEEVANEGGAIRHPLGNERFTLTEFYQAVHFALRALRMGRGES